jgi:outer membrane translocation and assembly module TamA
MIGLNAMSILSAGMESFNLVPEYISNINLQRTAFNSYSFNYQYQINTVDTKYYPNRGTMSSIGVNTSKLISGRVKTSQFDRMYDSDFPEDFRFRRTYSLVGNLRQYLTTGKKTTFSVKGSLLYTYYNDSTISHNNYYFIGGINNTTKRSISMTGFHTNEIPAERFASVGFDADIELLRDLHLELLTDAGIAREVGMGSELTYMGGFGLGLGYMSIIGPIRVGFMYGLSSRERYYNNLKGFISIGFNF